MSYHGRRPRPRHQGQGRCPRPRGRRDCRCHLGRNPLRRPDHPSTGHPGTCCKSSSPTSSVCCRSVPSENQRKRYVIERVVIDVESRGDRLARTNNCGISRHRSLTRPARSALATASRNAKLRDTRANVIKGTRISKRILLDARRDLCDMKGNPGPAVH